ncbi:Large neutral amino acids transporter small subunit 1 [Strongyloides ratti]|uniref:Large neutral amino acids transporter small subunit 1 n=1 Tax=Strongyloides ratti TaxID=34506 RepID=A0A090KXJ3_STRRB|nr:Large neutral amino acids transporter small subunit 1 [Strongyloides ratti]CEF59983.1 Large neutral amino acids transporter small subunit 1 [Strongyloides ratti]
MEKFDKNNDILIPVNENIKNKEETGGLQPTITLFGGVMVIVGCIIGSGIFISPKGVHENVDSIGLSLIIWILCGIFTGIGAYCYAELGTFIQQSGGDYAYVLVAYGPMLGFMRMWIESVIVRPCTITAVAITFSTYIIYPFSSYQNTIPFMPHIIACCGILLLTYCNCWSIKITTLIQNIFTIAKLFALITIILTGIYLLFFNNKSQIHLDNLFYIPTVSYGKLAMAFYSGLWAFNGWNFLNVITEELIDPSKNLPKAIGISITLCMSIEEFITSYAIAITFANKYYGILSVLMPILVAFSCFGTVNGIMLTSSRLFFVASRNGHMPKIFSYINRENNTPIPAVCFTSILSIFYLFLSSNIYTLINYVQIVNWIAITIATSALLWLRVKKPPKIYKRPLKVNIIFPIIFLIGCSFLIIFPIIQAPKDTLIGIGLLLTGLPIYYVFVKYNLNIQLFDKLVNKIAELCIIHFNVTPIEKISFIQYYNRMNYFY